MLGVFANHANDPFSLEDLALVANPLNGRSHFHFSPLTIFLIIFLIIFSAVFRLLLTAPLETTQIDPTTRKWPRVVGCRRLL